MLDESRQGDEPEQRNKKPIEYKFHFAVQESAKFKQPTANNLRNEQHGYACVGRISTKAEIYSSPRQDNAK